MALYRYSAAEKGEVAREILIEAGNRAEALNKIRGRGMIPVRYLGEAGAVDKGNLLSIFAKRSKVDTFAFTRQLCPLLNSHVPLERAMAIIAEGSAQEDQKNFVNSLRQGLHEGKKFSELVRSHGSLFPGYYANLIESGEETGCLPEVLTHLYKFMEESKDLRSFIISSSIYPCAILIVTVLVTILMFTVFVPQFARIFEDMGRTMPPSMQFLLTMSSFFKMLLPILLLIIAGIYGFRKYIGEERWLLGKSRLLLAMPLFGKIIADLEMCRYIRTLAIMIANHVEIIRTVRIAEKIIHNPVIGNTFHGLADKIKGGAKLSAALKDNPFVPGEMVPMLRVGEESGSVGEMLKNIADNLEGDTRLKIKRLLSLFEPAVIVFLAAVVLIVVASIFMAMMDLNAINSQGGPKL